MFDDLDRLRGDDALQRLLGHYVEAGAAQAEAWQDRVMEMEGVEPKGLTRLHGELIAFGWVEQNTGQTSAVRPGVAAGCYRATRDGARALKLVQRRPTVADNLERDGAEPETVEKESRPRPKKHRAKQVSSATQEPLVIAQAAVAD